MNPGDEVYIQTQDIQFMNPKFIFKVVCQSHIDIIKLIMVFNIDVDCIARSISNKTKVLILNNYQNPMSASSSEEELKELAKLSIKHNLVVLSDDAYYEIQYSDEPPRSIVNFSWYEKEDSDFIYIFKKICYDRMARWCLNWSRIYHKTYS